MSTALTRPFWTVLLVAALLGTGCGPSVDDAPPLPTRTEEALALLPADAQFAGMLDLQDLQQNGGLSFSSERGITVQFLDSDVTFNPLSSEQQNRLSAFIDATGFEPGSDLHAAYVVGDSTQPQAVLFAASYERERLTSELMAQFDARLDTSSYRDTPILRLRPEDGDSLSQNGTPLQFALMRDGWMALSSDTARLRAIIDRSLSDDAAPDSPAMMPLVTALGGRGGAWMAVRDLPSQRMAQSANEQRLAQLARAVRDAGMALSFRQDGVEGTILLTTNQDPADVADVVRGAVSTLKLQGDLTTEQQDLLDRITVTEARGERVWVTFDVPQETLARILIQSMRGTQRGAVAIAR